MGDEYNVECLVNVNGMKIFLHRSVPQSEASCISSFIWWTEHFVSFHLKVHRVIPDYDGHHKNAKKTCILFILGDAYDRKTEI